MPAASHRRLPAFIFHSCFGLVTLLVGEHLYKICLTLFYFKFDDVKL